MNTRKLIYVPLAPIPCSTSPSTPYLMVYILYIYIYIYIEGDSDSPRMIGIQDEQSEFPSMGENTGEHTPMGMQEMGSLPMQQLHRIWELTPNHVTPSTLFPDLEMMYPNSHKLREEEPKLERKCEKEGVRGKAEGKMHRSGGMHTKSGSSSTISTLDSSLVVIPHRICVWREIKDSANMLLNREILNLMEEPPINIKYEEHLLGVVRRIIVNMKENEVHDINSWVNMGSRRGSNTDSQDSSWGRGSRSSSGYPSPCLSSISLEGGNRRLRMPITGFEGIHSYVPFISHNNYYDNNQNYMTKIPAAMFTPTATSTATTIPLHTK